MQIREDHRGIVKTICVLVLDNDSVPAVDFLRHLKQTNVESHKSMVIRYKRHAERGPSQNKRQERHVKSHGNLWEFKTDQGDRLLYFNISGNRIVLVSGFHKGDQEQQRYNEASNLRDAYLSQEG